MPTTRAVVEWFAFGLLRLAATCTAAAGLALLAAAAAVQVAGITADWARVILAGSLGIAVAFLLAGGLSLYLRHARIMLLADGLDSQQSTGSGVGGWLILFLLTLIATPAFMILRLRPLANFWRDVFALADRLNFWEGLQKNTGDSGYVLMPIFSALALPGLDAAAAMAAVVGAVLLVGLLLVRSSRVPRALLLCVILQGALVLGAAVGAVVVERLAPAIEQLVRSTPDPGGLEQPRIMAELQRYVAVVRSASGTLAWSWAAMAIWAPLLLLTARGRSTFAAVTSSGVPTLAASTNQAPNDSAMDDQARQRAYRDAARQVDRSTRPSF